jgi:rubrerythrin
MEAMKESWTDDRLDDLNGKVDALRIEMKTEFASVRGEMREGFERIEKRFDKMEERFAKSDERFEKAEIRNAERFERAEIRSDERFEAMMERFDQRLDSLNHLVILFSGGVCAALITALAGLIATQL